MKLHAHPASTTCRPILHFAAESGIAIELAFVDLFAGDHRSPAYAAINPDRAVPVLEDGSFRLTQCSAILKYLAERAGSPAYPAEPQARARVNALMDWFNTDFHRAFGYGLVYPQVLPHHAWPDAQMQDVALARAEAEARRRLDVLDRHLLDDESPFLGGAAPSLADYLGAAYVTTGELIGFDLARWPRVQRWLAAMTARPAWASTNGAFEGWCEIHRQARRYRIAA
ncbi:glutathione S-transferase family protein [Elioraea sp. Yellowstone]|jgi:glutathione S-transferase|uniref:glutathione S-transferase family protein n=1 Tax=Elioraea sp. Yellowstone TaxID=2592070 RepID=UPI00114D8984|nr:glutathione S-transferase family protein [Elioraea sp. Yellowstone]TQF80975.1 glutathione S-transferase family protein [Elioraea sp. Yellowstone]